MDIEKAIAALQESVHGLSQDMAVVRAQMDNHISGLTEDIRELKGDVRETRNKVERLFGVVMSPPQKRENSGAVEYRTLAGWLVSAMLGLAYIIVEFVLKR